jgi:hypothetical protein
MFAYAPTAHLPVCDCRRKAGSLGSSSATSSSILVAFSIGGDANGVGLSCERARLYAGLNPLAKGPAISRHDRFTYVSQKWREEKRTRDTLVEVRCSRILRPTRAPLALISAYCIHSTTPFWYIPRTR